MVVFELIDKFLGYSLSILKVLITHKERCPLTMRTEVLSLVSILNNFTFFLHKMRLVIK